MDDPHAVLILDHSFQELLSRVHRFLGDKVKVVVLALRRDAEPLDGQAPLTEKSGAATSGSRIVFIDEAGFDPRALGAELGSAVVLMNGGTTHHVWASIRIYDGLVKGQLVNEQPKQSNTFETK